jgi:hypothetical protein
LSKLAKVITAILGKCKIAVITFKHLIQLLTSINPFFMKNTILFLYIFCGVLTFAEAQIQKGTYTMRPILSINSETDYLSSSASTGRPIRLAADMNYGKFVTENLLLSGGLGGFYSQKGKYYGSSIFAGGQYYYWQNAIIKPYVSGSINLSKRIYATQTSAIQPVKTRANEYSASVAMGAQYFFNENVALDFKLIFSVFEEKFKPNPSGFQSKPIFQQAYTLDLQPFYSMATYNSAKEVKDFFYGGKAQVSGNVNLMLKPYGVQGGENSLNVSLGSTYFLHKFFGLGASLDVDYYGFYQSFIYGLRAESNIKIFKRFYLSPNVVYNSGKFNVIGLGTSKISSASANLQAKFFMNKNIAFTADLLSFPIYNSQKNVEATGKLFFKSGFAYYLN